MSKSICKSMLKLYLLIVISCTLYGDARSQTIDSLLRVYNSETIHTFGRLYVKGNTQLKFRDLKPEFTSPATKDLYRKAKSNLALGNVLTVTAIAAVVSGVILRKDHATSAFLLTTAGVGLNLSSIHFRNISSQLTGRAIWQRNKEILFGVR